MSLLPSPFAIFMAMPTLDVRVSEVNTNIDSET